MSYQKIPSRLSYKGRRMVCEDCGCSPDAPMLHDELWLRIATFKTLLCIGCTETRLNRSLTSADLTSCPMNGAALYFLQRYEDKKL